MWSVCGKVVAAGQESLLSSLMPFLVPSPLLLQRDASHLDAACELLIASNEQTLAWQCAVTRIAAPTGNEAARGRWMAEQFARIGWTDTTVDPVGNVSARQPRAGAVVPLRREVWCCAHLDTVFAEPSPEVHRDGERLTGPGIGDNGRGLAALLALGHALQEASVKSQHAIVLVCTVGEEGLGDLRGMKQLLRDATPPPLAVIAIDGAGDDRIVNTALGSTRWRITFYGAGGHSWANFGVANPVHAATAVAAALHSLPLARDPRTTLTIARIGGGDSINSIPRDGWLEVDIRSVSAKVLTDLEKSLRDIVARIERIENARRVPGTSALTSRIELLGQRPCGATADTSPLIRIAQQATRAIGATPRFAIGSTDASIPIAMGIPAIAIGAGGSGGGIHTPEEWYDDTNGIRGLQRALRIVVEAAGQEEA